LRPNQRTSLKLEVSINGETIKKDEVVANTFNDFFVNLPLSLNPNQFVSDQFLTLIPNNINSFFFSPIGLSEIKQILKGLKENSFVHSVLPAKILKLISDDLSPILCNLYNSCISNSYFPDELKVANVMPLFKKGSRKLLENYRPISLLNPITKIFEKIIFNRITDFFVREKMFSPEQFGFLPGRSIQDAVLNLLYDLNNALNKKQYSIVVFLDYSKAFDTVIHNVLLKKLYRYGFRSCMSDFLRSYFSSRKQAVVINDYVSKTLDVCIGVPQGSSLGPLFYLIFVNEFSKILSYCKSILYADDSVVYCSGDSIEELQARVNSDVAAIHKWSRANGLTLNVSKTKCMLITTSNVREKLDIRLNDIPIEEVESFQYLGIIIQNNLKYDQYLSELTTAVSRAAGIMYNLKNILPVSSLKSIYYSIVYPKLSMYILVWGKSSVNTLRPLRVALNKVVRSIIHPRLGEHTTELYRRLNILTLDQLYKFKSAQFMHKEHNCEQTCMFFDVRNDFEWSHDYGTRQDRPYRLPFNRMQLTERYFLNDALEFWTKIPDELKLPCSKHTFKKKIRNLLLENVL
jgi:hypothetical protein